MLRNCADYPSKLCWLSLQIVLIIPPNCADYPSKSVLLKATIQIYIWQMQESSMAGLLNYYVQYWEFNSLLRWLFDGARILDRFL
jgi:hypothetical protein